MNENISSAHNQLDYPPAREALPLFGRVFSICGRQRGRVPLTPFPDVLFIKINKKQAPGGFIVLTFAFGCGTINSSTHRSGVPPRAIRLNKPSFRGFSHADEVPDISECLGCPRGQSGGMSFIGVGCHTQVCSIYWKWARKLNKRVDVYERNR